MTTNSITVPRRQPPSALHRLYRRIEGRLQRFVLSDETAIRQRFKRKYGFALDLRHPKMFVEKINWLKLHEYSPLHGQCADKIRVRDYVRERLGEAFLIPTLLVTYDLDDFRPTTITAEQFVAKTNHDYDSVLICKDRTQFDWAAARHTLQTNLSRNWYWSKRERAYRDIAPGIIVERFLAGDDGKDIADFKFYCFGGRVELIQVIEGRFAERTITMYDRDWRRLPIRRRGVPMAEVAHPRPPRLAEMIEVAETLAEPFTFARIDLYDAAGRTWFGEITFYPAGGLALFDPIEYEHQFGALLKLPRSPCPS